jgi:glyoxylase I family protein
MKSLHHIAIIATDYAFSRDFYTRVLGLEIIREVYREGRDSWKCDLALNGTFVIELFSFPNPPPRPTRPEAAGLRHLAFSVSDIEVEMAKIQRFGIVVEPVRVDDYTGRRYTFFVDLDALPIELYEA